MVPAPAVSDQGIAYVGSTNVTARDGPKPALYSPPQTGGWVPALTSLYSAEWNPPFRAYPTLLHHIRRNPRRLTDALRLARMPDSLIAWAVMLTIGLTGGIGSGKSAVANLLQQLGASIIDADRLGHEAYTPNSEAWRQVVAAFGEDILTAEGEIDRRKLGAIVFADPAQLARLNGIMHPLMAGMVAERKAQLKAAGESVAVVEAAVLFEAGWDSLVDEVWTTNASTGAVVERLRQRNGLSEAEARKRINSQMPAEERNRRSDVVVDNSADLAALELAVRDLWQNRVKGKVHQGNG